MNNKFFTTGNHGTFFWLGKKTALAINPWGNCFQGIIFKTKGLKGIFSLTYRGPLGRKTRYGAETTIYVRSIFRWDWNSEHLAEMFGKETETSFGSVFHWRGHVSV